MILQRVCRACFLLPKVALCQDMHVSVAVCSATLAANEFVKLYVVTVGRLQASA